MTSPQVMVDVEQLDRVVLAEVGAACARAHAEVVPWRRAAEPDSTPALVIGVLRRGERRIPAELVDAVARLAPDAGLLLVSDEPLVRPVVSTHEGRVTLLAQPASAARIRGTVRMLLAERGDFCHERIDARVWTAVFEPAGGPASPAFRQDDDGTLTAVFPLIPGWSGAEPLCDDVHSVAVAHIDDDERFERLLELLGQAAGLIHLTGGREWTAYWPSATSPLLLYSPLRLPRMCNLAGAASSQVLHLTATSGDLLVALSHELAIDPTGGVSRSGGDGLTLGDGGAAFVEQVEAQRAAGGAMPSGMAVEIR